MSESFGEVLKNREDCGFKKGAPRVRFLKRGGAGAEGRKNRSLITCGHFKESGHINKLTQRERPVQAPLTGVSEALNLTRKTPFWRIFEQTGEATDVGPVHLNLRDTSR
jgi:hypothetical protein